MDEWEPIAQRGRSHPILIIDMAAEGYREAVEGTRELEFVPGSYCQLDAGSYNGRFMRAVDIRAYVDTLRGLELREPGFLFRLAKRVLDDTRRARAVADAIGKTGYGEGTAWDELAAGFSRFGEAYRSVTCRGYHYIMLNKFYPDLLSAAIAKRVSDPHEQARIASVLFSCAKPTGIRMEKGELVRLAEIMTARGLQPDSPEVSVALEGIAEKFGFLGLYCMRGSPSTAATLRPRLAELCANGFESEAAELTRQDGLARETAAIEQRLGFSPAERMLVKTAQEWAFAGNEEDETYGYMTWRGLGLLNEAARRLEIALGDLLNMRLEEIQRALSRKAPLDREFKNRLSKRDGANVLLWEGGVVRVLEGPDFEAFYAREKKSEESLHHVRELKGQPASPGKVQGRVRLIGGIDDVPKLLKGEILVAVATIPAYVPAMEKAAAIVTNEGGLLCHAAIVSRELGVPCVVGTKTATRVFVDGELVEVDALKGIVRKIS